MVKPAHPQSQDQDGMGTGKPDGAGYAGCAGTRRVHSRIRGLTISPRLEALRIFNAIRPTTANDRDPHATCAGKYFKAYRSLCHRVPVAKPGWHGNEETGRGRIRRLRCGVGVNYSNPFALSRFFLINFSASSNVEADSTPRIAPSILTLAWLKC